MVLFVLKTLSRPLLQLRSQMYIVFYVKYPLFLSDFNDLNFLDGFFKNAQMSNFIKIHPVEAELFHADGWTDRHDKARSHFFVI